MDINDLNNLYSTQLAERNLLTKLAKKTKVQLIKAQKEYQAAIHARAYLQHEAQQTQNKLESYISNLVSLSLNSVFVEPYEFMARFVQRRNKTECDLIFIKDNEEYVPIESSGGGPLDVASLTLRISFWSLGSSRPTIILDEPGKFVSQDLQEKVSQMVKEISQKLNLQFIIITHQDDMVTASDKTFIVKGGKLITT